MLAITIWLNNYKHSSDCGVGDFFAGNWWNTDACFSPEMNASGIHAKTNHTTTPVEEYWEWVSSLFIHAPSLQQALSCFIFYMYTRIKLCLCVSAASVCCKSPAESTRWAACSGSCSVVCCSVGSSSTASSAAAFTRAERWQNTYNLLGRLKRWSFLNIKYNKICLIILSNFKFT